MSEVGSGPENLDGTIEWGALLAETRHRLVAGGVADNPRQESKWILEEVTDTSGAEFAEAMTELATTRGVARLDAMVARRNAGEPIQYVLGHWSFRTLDLMIDQRVLIPRPETEEVTGLAIAELDRMHPDGGGVALDLGTGSGAIGLSVAVERPRTDVVLTDVSEDAIAVARANLSGLGLGGRSVAIEVGSWFEALAGRDHHSFDVIVSNPPYVETTAELAGSVLDWEPVGALRSGADGLDDLRVIIAQAPTWLRPGGALVAEIGATQGDAVAELMKAEGFTVTVHKDTAGLDRGLVARWSES